jgi:enoyl-CoA hydratase/carnithine racemase
MAWREVAGVRCRGAPAWIGHRGRPRKLRAVETLRIERQDGVVSITLDRPEKRNAINGVMWDELLATFQEIAATPSDRCVVITGAGGAFCSGADLSGERPESERPHQLQVMRHVNNVAVALHELAQPTIAKVTGVAAGAGANLAFGCDLIVASEEARFSEIFTRRGLSVDFGGTWLLPRLVGLHRAKELAFFADIISAKEAAELGLVNRLVAAADIDRFVDDWAQRLASGPPIAMSQTKQMLNRSFEQTLSQSLDDEAWSQTVNFSTKDTAEAIDAFLAKREPRFTGR